MVNYKRVQGTKDQLEFYSDSEIDQIYLDNEDANIQYNFMTWKISDERKKFLMYDNGVGLNFYDVVVKMKNGSEHKFKIENINL
jgi:hypothetical protein